MRTDGRKGERYEAINRFSQFFEHALKKYTSNYIEASLHRRNELQVLIHRVQ